jgi:Tfp pilus assembly protein PilF
MKAGLDALYVKRDPAAAAKAFRKILDKNPNHYGTNFQLAMALTDAGKPSEARPQWERALAMAEGVRDEKTAEAARRG